MLGRDRERANLEVRDSTMVVSSRHAQFVIDNSFPCLEDCESMNGTWIRLSPSRVPSQNFLMTEGMSVRLATGKILVNKNLN